MFSIFPYQDSDLYRRRIPLQLLRLPTQSTRSVRPIDPAVLGSEYASWWEPRQGICQAVRGAASSTSPATLALMSLVPGQAGIFIGSRQHTTRPWHAGRRLSGAAAKGWSLEATPRGYLLFERKGRKAKGQAESFPGGLGSGRVQNGRARVWQLSDSDEDSTKSIFSSRSFSDDFSALL